MNRAEALPSPFSRTTTCLMMPNAGVHKRSHESRSKAHDWQNGAAPKIESAEAVMPDNLCSERSRLVCPERRSALFDLVKTQP